MDFQVAAAQRMYNARASSYEVSWHPVYSKRLMDLVTVEPGDHVLVLCCGTGLETFIAAKMVGPTGLVIGIDVSAGMLAKAAARQDRETELGKRIKLVKHDVKDLDACDELRHLKGGFDVAICSNAFVLLDNPADIVRSWKWWLKPQGRLVIDIPHETNMVHGVIIEKVADNMGIRWPSNRRWVKNQYSFRDILEAEGMLVDKMEVIEKATGLPGTYDDMDKADERFEFVVKSPFTSFVWEKADINRARKLFMKEWEAIAVDGKVGIVDALYLYIARKA